MAGKHTAEVSEYTIREKGLGNLAAEGRLPTALFRRGDHFADSAENAALRRLSADLYNENTVRVLTIEGGVS